MAHGEGVSYESSELKSLKEALKKAHKKVYAQTEDNSYGTFLSTLKCKNQKKVITTIPPGQVSYKN